MQLNYKYIAIFIANWQLQLLILSTEVAAYLKELKIRHGAAETR